MKLGIILLSIQEGFVQADTAAPGISVAEGSTKEMLTVWELLMSGGLWIMIPLVAMLAIAIVIFVERFLVINRSSKEESSFMHNIRDFIHDGKVDAAIALCRSTTTPIARMIEKGISRIGRPLNDVNAAIENVGKLEVSKLEKHIATLATIAGAAPMIGFLGTVVGMVRVFFDISSQGNQIELAALSTGMYQAMVTTISGLIVGVLAYIAYNVLVARIEKIVFILEARATEFMDLLHEPAS